MICQTGILTIKKTSDFFGYYHNSRPNHIVWDQQSKIQTSTSRNTILRSHGIIPPGDSYEWFDVCAWRFRFTLHVRSASMVCLSSGTELPENIKWDIMLPQLYTDNTLEYEKLWEKRLRLLFNAQTLKLEQVLDCHTTLSKKKGGGTATYIKLHRGQEHTKG